MKLQTYYEISKVRFVKNEGWVGPPEVIYSGEIQSAKTIEEITRRMRHLLSFHFGTDVNTDSFTLEHFEKNRWDGQASLKDPVREEPALLQVNTWVKKVEPYIPEQGGDNSEQQ